jgi:phospholipase C
MPAATVPPEHVVVLMLENRSFDHMLGYLSREIPGIDGLSGRESNPLDVGQPTAKLKSVSDDAAYIGDFTRTVGSKNTVEVDPGHEFQDADSQVYALVGGQRPAAPNNLGFVDNYRVQKNGSMELAPNVMKCFAPARVPVLTTLTREFAVCDHWFSPVPGPTWPNRLFVHAGTSDGQVVHKKKLYGMQTIYDQLWGKKLSARIYAGDIAQSLLLKRLLFSGIFFQMPAFYAHLRKKTLATYSFIEPDYFGRNATDQHPPHDVAAGEHLIADVYEALRRSPYWEKSVLVVTYDEHGGLYDHVPPPAAPKPDQRASAAPKFDFSRYGVRVPAVVVSPFVPRGTVDHTEYDHTSIIATLREWFRLGDPLTRRDAAAKTFAGLLSLSSPRTDAPTTLPRPPRSRARAPVRAAPTPVPLSHLQRQLLELADEVAAVHQRAGVPAIRARPRAAFDEEDAKTYVQSVYSQETEVTAALEGEVPVRPRRRSRTKPKRKQRKS